MDIIYFSSRSLFSAKSTYFSETALEKTKLHEEILTPLLTTRKFRILLDGCAFLAPLAVSHDPFLFEEMDLIPSTYMHPP